MAEQITLVSGDSSGDQSDPCWWQGYRDALAKQTGLSETAISVTDLDAQYIVDKGVFAHGNPVIDSAEWPEGRVSRGLVMGSVQSGKTASMLAVSAKAIDAGVNLIVILAGTRLALWQQTFERMKVQLDGWSPEISDERAYRRTLIPAPELMEEEHSSLSLDDLYSFSSVKFNKHIRSSKPIVAVVMKQPDHLHTLAKVIQEGVQKAESLGKPIHLLVIDDEADDGSVLDRSAENALADDSDSFKQIPRHIARLWVGKGSGAVSSTLSPQLFATYLAYTATPQANFLQSDHNPLSPRDFVIALRTPAEEGLVDPPRSITYREPRGLPSHYIGGEYFYNKECSDSASPVQRYPQLEQGDYATHDDFENALQQQADQMLGDSLRNFFVAGAMRLLLDGKKYSDVKGQSFCEKSTLKSLCPNPHSMLVHPSARVDEHDRVAHLVSRWSSGSDRPSSEISTDAVDEDGRPVLSEVGLVNRLRSETSEWEKCFTNFLDTWQQLFQHGADKPPGLEEITWDVVRSTLIDEVFKYARLSVVNSDLQSDDCPRFLPTEEGDLWHAPRDLLTVFVSGNVMSRGITLEGLTTTLFVRSTADPAADTQMQMQRWFGYRGKFFGFCRVFLFEDQYERFRDYHLNDQSLRREVIHRMNSTTMRAPSPLVLQGVGYTATNKISNLSSLPLCPGAQPFVRMVAAGNAASKNCDLLSSQLEDGTWESLVVGGTDRGLIRTDPISLIEAASLLEAFRYDNYVPNPDSPVNRRWGSIGQNLCLDTSDLPLFRPPVCEVNPEMTVDPRQCPYSIAAYLRVWQHLLSRKAPGFFPTDNPRLPWSSINHALYRERAPKFYLGVRFGEAGDPVDSRLRLRGIKCMRRRIEENRLVATWGSRNPGEGVDSYLGDHLFDYHLTKNVAPNHRFGETPWRPSGHPGLILFHVIKNDSKDLDLVTVGLAIPLGGPDHIAAITTTS